MNGLAVRGDASGFGEGLVRGVGLPRPYGSRGLFLSFEGLFPGLRPCLRRFQGFIEISIRRGLLA
jgi:hypothetical protein